MTATMIESSVVATIVDEAITNTIPEQRQVEEEIEEERHRQLVEEEAERRTQQEVAHRVRNSDANTDNRDGNNDNSNSNNNNPINIALLDHHNSQHHHFRHPVLWNPVELFERIFPPLLPWLHDHHQEHTMKRNHKKNRLCPAVTLFFDSKTKSTIVVLSGEFQKMRLEENSLPNIEANNTVSRIQAIISYLRKLVENGTAIQRSPLYYELRGYIRPNRTMILRHYFYGLRAEHDDNPIPLLCPTEDVSMAVGALEESDRSQEKELLHDRMMKLNRLRNNSNNKICSKCLRDCTSLNEEQLLVSTTKSQDTVKGQLTSYSQDTKPNETSDNDYLWLMGEALEIARLHRLAEDLDILSVYCMRITNKSMGNVASRIAQDKMNQVKLTITPYVDGISLSGYSRFMRLPHQQGVSNVLLQHPVIERSTASGRPVEYVKCRDVELVRRVAAGESMTNDGKVPKANATTSCDKHATPRQVREEDCEASEAMIVGPFTSFVPSMRSERNLHWNCEEFVLPNLHCREWGDILVRRDYLGQNLVIKWHPGPVDYYPEIDTSVGRPKNDDTSTRTLAILRLDAPSHDTSRVMTIPMVVNQHINNVATTMSNNYRKNATTSKASISLEIQQSQKLIRDTFGFNATTVHSGRMTIQSVQLDFPCLVRAAAKSRISSLEQQYRQMEEFRPILSHERQYMELLQELVTL